MDHKYGAKEVIELQVFDESGNKITTLDTLKRSELIIAGVGFAQVKVRDALLDFKLLEYLGEVVETNTNLSDFDKAIGIKPMKVIKFGKEDAKKCKLVGTAIVRNSATGNDEEVLFSAKNAEVKKAFSLTTNAGGDVAVFDLVFQMNVDSEGNIITFMLSK